MPKFTFTSPDGKNYDVEGPEGSTKEQAFQILQQHVGSNKPGKAEPWSPYLADQLKNVPGDLYGLMDLAVSPVQAPYAALMKKYAGKEISTHPMKEAWDKIMGVQGRNVPKDEYGKPSFWPEMLGNIARYGAGGAATGGLAGVPAGLSALAKSGLVGGLQGMSAGAWGTSGKYAGEQISPEMGKYGELIGSMLVPMGTSKLGNLGFSAAQKGSEFAKSKLGLGTAASEKLAKTHAGEELGRSVASHAPSQLEQAQAEQIEKKVPGLKYTFPQITGAPGVQAIQKRITSKTPEAFGKAKEIERKQEEAIGAYKESKFPEGKSDVMQRVQKSADEERSRLDRNLRKVEQELASKSSHRTEGETADVGSEIRDLREKRKVASKASADARYKGVYETAKAANVQPDVAGVLTKAKDIKKEGGQIFQDKPSVVNDVIREFTTELTPGPQILGPNGKPISVPKPPETKVGFEKFHSLWKRVHEDARAAEYAGDRNEARLLNQLDSSMRMELDRQGPVSQQLKEADEFYKTRYIKPFFEGLGGKIGAKGPMGMRVQDASIVGKMVMTTDKEGGPAGIREYLNMAGNEPGSRELLKRGIEDTFYREVTQSGMINPKSARSFFSKYKSVLDEVPGIRDDLIKQAKSSTALQEHIDRVKHDLSTFDQSVVSKMSKNEDVDAVLTKALKSRGSMSELIGTAKTADEKASMTRALIDHIMKSKNPAEMLSQNERVMKPAFDSLGRGHWDNANTLVSAFSRMEKGKTPTTIELADVGDAAKKTIGSSWTRIVSLFNNVTQGRQSLKTAATVAGSSFLNKIQTERRDAILAEAMYDRDLAQAIINQAMQPQSKEALKKLNDQISRHALTVGAVTYGKEKERQDRPGEIPSPP